MVPQIFMKALCHVGRRLLTTVTDSRVDLGDFSDFYGLGNRLGDGDGWIG